MKRLLLVLCLLLCASPAFATITQSRTASNAASATIAATFASNVTAGSFLVVGVDNDSGNAVSGITGNSCTWTFSKAQIWNFSTHGTELWSCANATAGATTVTVTHTGTGNNTLIIAEYPSADVASSSPLDKTASAQSGDGVNSSPADSGNTATTTQATELLIGVLGTFATDAQVTATNSFTKQANVLNSTSTVTIILQDRFVSATGAYNSTDTVSPTNQWGAVIGTFKAPVGATCTPTLSLLGVGRCG